MTRTAIAAPAAPEPAPVRITLVEAARRLGLSPKTLAAQRANGRFQADKVGRDWLTTEAEVERYREASRGKAGRPDGAKDSRPRRKAGAA